ncbi:MAG: HEWD family protein [Halobacteriota archaeon]
MTGAKLRKPTKRICELCERREAWDEETGTWRLAADGEEQSGSVYCIHEWDINGTFLPFEE